MNNSSSKAKKRGNKSTTSKQHRQDQKSTEASVVAKAPGPWAPGAYITVKALLSARLCSAVWGIIADCDETFNYWEPTHYLVYSRGLQTWEYSPDYALRSWSYVGFHALPAAIYSSLFGGAARPLVFFFVRCLLAIAAASSELYFYTGIVKELGGSVGRLTLGISLFSAGMFGASTAFLPSSFAMYMTMLSYGAWLRGYFALAIFTTALSAFLGWPFAALIGVPIAIDLLVIRRRFLTFFKWSIISAFTILAPMIQIDSSFYGKFVLAPSNLVWYNVFGGVGGSSLYGTEPLSFYFKNAFLNFNFAFLAALVSIPLVILCAWMLPSASFLPRKRLCLYLSGLFLWLAVFLAQPHKEERFLFPIYPLITLAAAVTIDASQQLLGALLAKFGLKRTEYSRPTGLVTVIFVAICAILSVSRIVGQYKGYRAPIDTLLELSRLRDSGSLPLTVGRKGVVNVCYGKEWYRFPSSFFLPDLDWQVRFVRSDFRGQLPQPFSTSANSTAISPPFMNDKNQEQNELYWPISSCHFMVDSRPQNDRNRAEEDESGLKASQWRVLYRIPFLDAQRSPWLFRAFYVPFVTERLCTYVDYVLLQSTSSIKAAPG